MVKIAPVGSTVTFILYTIHSEQTVSGKVTAHKHRGSGDKVTSLLVDLTYMGAGHVALPPDKVLSWE